MNDGKGSSEKPEGEQEVESDKGLPSSYCTVYVVRVSASCLYSQGNSCCSMINDEPVGVYSLLISYVSQRSFRYTGRGPRQ